MGAESNEQLKREHEARQKRDTKAAWASANKEMQQSSSGGGSSNSSGGSGCIVVLGIVIATLNTLSFSLIN